MKNVFINLQKTGTVIAFFLLFISGLTAQSNIQQSLSVNSTGAAPDASAQLDVSATDKGMLVPRMTSAQRTAIASPATGLLVFDTTTGGFWFYNGTSWVNLSTPKTLADADNDTKIQVEKNPDEDIIRFDLAGTENMVLRKSTGGYARLEIGTGANGNIFMGLGTGATTTGLYNTAFGQSAFYSNTIGGNNTALGYNALALNTTGSANTALGQAALISSNGNHNTATGKDALVLNTAGDGNTANGRSALASNTTGSNNTALGYNADVLSGALTNATAIGYNAKVNCSRCLVLGGTGTDSVNVGIGTSTPTRPLHLRANGYGFSHTYGGIEMATYVDDGAPSGGWLGTVSNHPLFFYTNDGFPQMTLTTAGALAMGTVTPHSSAMVELSATDKGMLVPRMTTAQRTAIASPATGLLVYDNDTNAFWFYNGTAWTTISGGVSTLIADADNDTKVQVEENPDEDIIRFDVGGTEGMVLRKNSSGHQRLELPNGASNNIFIGLNAGSANTTGGFSVAVGKDALLSNISGFTNVAIGAEALKTNTIGQQNVAIGSYTLRSNNVGNTNTAIGHAALELNTSGHSNTATGVWALRSNATGQNNTGHGRDALSANTTGWNNTALGRDALLTNTTGSNNTAVGWGADVMTDNLTNATAIGYNAKVGASNSLVLGGIGADAVKVGIGTTTPNTSALLDLTSTDKGMLVPRMTSAQRTAIASPATGLLVYDNDTNAFWFYNGTAWARISPQTLLADADNDTKIQVEKNPDEDIIRFDLGGTENMVLRKNAGGSPWLDLPNTFGNTFVGTIAGSANTTGNANTAYGFNALSSNTTGGANTASGTQALSSNTTGLGNTAVGQWALFSNTTGGSNTCLGYDTNVSSGGLQNATAIGKGATVNASNKVRIGNGSVTVIEGQVDWTFPSDARFKFNVHDDQVPGLSFINKLRPVTYQFDTRKFDEHLMQNMPDSLQRRRMEGQDYSKSTAQVQTGLLAQEVEQICKDLGYDFSGLHVPKSEVDNYGLAYGSFVPLLVKAVQEQQKEIEKLEIGNLEIEKLKAENAALKAQLDVEKSANALQSAQLAKITAALAGAGIAVEK